MGPRLSWTIGALAVGCPVTLATIMRGVPPGPTFDALPAVAKVMVLGGAMAFGLGTLFATIASIMLLIGIFNAR